MSVSGFEEFAEAVSGRDKALLDKPTQRFGNVTVLGGGEDARLLAALCQSEGASVTLFSAYGTELEALRNAGGITIRGAGPIGTYQVDQPGIPSIKTSAELDKAVGESDLIFLTGPVHKQRTYAMVLADHVRDGQVLVLAPGRTFGAAEAAWLLRIGGRKADITIVEASSLPFWIDASGSTLTLSPAGSVSAATLPAGRSEVVSALSDLLPNIRPAVSTLHSSFCDGSGLVEVPALTIGGPAVGAGGPAVPEGGVPLIENRTFRNLVGDSHLAIMEQMARERHKVAAAYGVRDVPSLDEWLDIHAGTTDGHNVRPVPDQACARALVRCATIGSLVPLVSAAKLAEIATPATDAMITLSSAVLDADIASAGRRMDAIGIAADNLDDARRIFDRLGRGSGS